jgi:hypothetical protein
MRDTIMESLNGSRGDLMLRFISILIYPILRQIHHICLDIYSHDQKSTFSLNPPFSLRLNTVLSFTTFN